MSELLGYIDSITFINPENGFTVAKLNHKSNLYPIVGYLPSIQPGETILCQGEWKNHPTYGKQFEVKEYTIKYPTDLLGIQKYLESGLIKGIGPVYAEKIVKKFGLDTLDVIENTPNKLSQIEGIGPKRIKKIKECFDEQKQIRDLIIFLKVCSVSTTFAQRIYKIYQQNSIKLIKENPYRLAKEIHGIGFKTADAIAIKCGFDKDHPLRIEAAVEFSLWELSSEGHTCYPEKALILFTEKLLLIEISAIERALKRLLEKKELLQNNIIINNEEVSFIWLKTVYYYERQIESEIKRINEHPCALRAIDMPKAIDWAQKKLHIELAENQKAAITLSMQKKMHIITGGPGTGKSTITNVILKISEQLTNKIILCAPTGRAAKRLTQITRKRAFTVHALLEMNFENGGFKKNRDNPIKCDLLIIDEASMVDTMLIYFLLRAVPNSARVIIIGDVDQLPSVGPGTVLKDIINSKIISVTRLTEIFRQAAFSKIVTNSHRINCGEFPDISNDKNSDFEFIEEEDVQNLQKKLIFLVKEELPKRHNFDPVNDIQVISPMKRGPIGTEMLNSLLQAALNPSDKPLFHAGSRFHLHDKVMQIKNNYDKGVFNGDIGKIVQIDLSEKQLILSFDEKEVAYDFLELDEILLAYAISVHKFQGSESPCIVIPVHLSHFVMLQRNLLYTAVTRGKRRVAVLGTKKALAIALKNSGCTQRHTGLFKLRA